MGRFFSIGEALIDFIPQKKGIALKDVSEFKRVPGGAPANVSAAVSKLKGDSYFISKLGEDAFGDIIIDTLNFVGVNTENVLRTKEANTGLAFVSLKENGERDFSFYRDPSADMLLNEDEVDKIEFNKGDIIHFCSVDLIDAPVKKAHKRVIKNVLKNDGLVSFDPNVRLPLWDSEKKCKEAINEFIPYAHILKVSDEELEFITGIKDTNKALKSLFKGNVEAVIYTMGGNGAEFITKDKKVTSKGFKVDVNDTTGAGDSFIGAILSRLQFKGILNRDIKNISKDDIKQMLTFSNACAALTTTKKGAIKALPTEKEINQLIKEQR